MADSIEEKIVQNIVTTLQGITVANGYNNTVKLVTDDPEAGLNLQLFPAIFVAVGSEVPDRGATSVTRREMNLTLEYWLRAQINPRAAAASLREGMEETLTVARLGVSGTLKLTLESTNPVESMIEIVRTTHRNVKRWRSGEMALRWTAAGMLEAERQFRRVVGYRDLPKLVAAIERELRPNEEAPMIEAA